MSNVEQPAINISYFNVDINNIRQRRNNVLFNVEFDNVDQRRKNVVIMTICKNLKRAKTYFWAWQKKIKLSTLSSKFKLLFQNLVGFIPHFKRNMEKNICKPRKSLYDIAKMLHDKNHI